MALPKKRSDTVIVHELLAFLQNQLNIIDEASLEQICSLHYTEEEIKAAKKVLRRSAKTSTFLPTRKTKKNDLQDMFKVFKETEPVNVPTFVARDLHLLPSVALENDVITMLLKDIMQLRTELKTARSKCSKEEQNYTQSEKSSYTESVASDLSSITDPDPSLYGSPTVVSINNERDIAAASRSVSTQSITTLASSCLLSTPSRSSTTTKSQPKQNVNSTNTSALPSTCGESLSGQITESSSIIDDSRGPIVDEDGFTLVESRCRSNCKSEKRKNVDRDDLILQKEFQITGVLEDVDENVMDITKQIMTAIGLLVSKRDIVDARRVGKRMMGKDADQHPRPIVVRVSRRSLQEEVLRCGNACGDNILIKNKQLRGNAPIRLREQLSKENRALLYKARLLCKENNWKYAWSRDGMIFVKECEGKPTFQVHDEKDLKFLK